MITSNGCNIGFGLPVHQPGGPVRMPSRYDPVREQLFSPTDQMANRMEEKMAGEWQNPALDHGDSQRFSVSMPPLQEHELFDSRSGGPMFGRKGDDEYHFADQPPLTPVEPIMAPIRTVLGRWDDKDF